MKKIVVILLLLLFTLLPLYPQANTGLNTRNEVFEYLQGAYNAQVSLSEKGRTKKEIKHILNDYFTNKYQKVFWKENMVNEDGKYLTYGSDFAKYYIPFYQFSDQTRVVINSKEIYVFEFFPENTEGPVGYKDHYEGLLLKKVHNAWKIDQYLYDQIPNRIIIKAKSAIK